METAAKKKLFMSPRFALPLLAVAVLIASFVVYYFVIMKRQEASGDDRALRSLAAVSSQLKGLVGTYGVVLKGATAEDRKHNKKGASQGSQGKDGSNILSFLAAQGSELGDVDNCQHSPDAKVLHARASQTEPWISAGVAPRDNGYNLELASNGWCAHVPFEKALSPLLGETPNQIFDEILLTDAAGTVLYQTQRAGIVVDDLAFLSWRIEGAGSRAEGSKKTEEAKSTGRASGQSSPSATDGGTGTTPEKSLSTFSGASESSNVFQIPLAGTHYRVYLVPVRLTVPSPSAGVGARFVLCGLIWQDHFRTRSHSLPLTVLTAIALAVFLVIVAAWPMLKFATMRRTEHVTRRAGLYYVLFSAATMTTMVLFIVHVNYGFSDPQTENNLKDLAVAIDRNVGEELKKVLLVMESVGESPQLKRAKFVPYKGRPCPEPEQPDEHRHPTVETDLLSKVGMQVAEYPYFRRLFVLDSQGFEQVQWTVDAKGPPPLRVCDRPYFQGTLRNDLWYLSEEGLLGRRFRVDPLYSKSTGEYLAAIAQPFAIQQSGKAVNSGVMMLVTPMLSLIRPVLPPDYGFAVIDQAGKVLFHSDSAKNGRENFFDEAGDSRALRAAVLARRPNWLDINYLGADYKVFVMPFTKIQQCPWSLIVFSNRSVLGDKQLERIVLLAILAGVYFAFLSASIVLLRRLLPCYDLAWPRESMNGNYSHIALVLGIIILLSYALVFQGTPKELLWFAVLIPASSIAFVILKLKSNLHAILWTAAVLGAAALLKLVWPVWNQTARGGSWGGSPYLSLTLICAAYLSLGSNSITDSLNNWKKWSLATVYSLGCFGLLVLVAGFPCIAFFKLSYDYDENLSSRRRQLLTMAALEKREQQVISQYLGVTVSGKSKPFADDLGKWLFLRRRLQEQLDLYDKAFRDQRTGQVYSRENTSLWPGWFVSVTENWLPHRAGSLANHVAGKSAEGSKWVWTEVGANRIRVEPMYKQTGVEAAAGSPETLALAKLALRDPMFLAQDLTYNLNVLRPWDFLGTIVFLTVILLAAMFWSIRSTMVKMFLLDKKMEEWKSTGLEEAITKHGNSILVGLPCSGKTQWLKDNEENKKIVLIDVAAGIRGQVFDRNPDDKVVALDHFECGIKDPLANEWKLSLLEQLVPGEGAKDRKVVIVTTIDPSFYFENAAEDPVHPLSKGTPNDRDMERWNRVLSRFEVFRLESDSVPASRKSYDQFLWSTCTWSEKIALHPLAEEGWANHKNYAALEHLCNRGLIKLNPARVRDEKFGKYVSGNLSPQERKSWALRDSTGLWDGLRTTLIVLLLGGLAALLFFNQNDILGYFATAISALTAATKIVAEVRGSRSSGAAKG